MDAQRRRLLWRMASEKSDNSTSCLIRGNAEAIAAANAIVPPRHSSTEGRFSILDSHAKSSDSESDFDTNQPPITFSRRVIPISNFSKSVDFSAGTTTLPMSTSVSRFRIVPLESRYKRGRWTCYDHYEKSHVTKNAKLSLPATKNKSFDVNNLSVRSLNEVMGPKTAPPLVAIQPLHVRFAFDLSSDDEGEIDAKRVPHAKKEKVLPPLLLSSSLQLLQPSPSTPPASSSSAPAAQKVLPVRIVTPPATLPALITPEIRPDDTKILSAVRAADLGMTLSLNNGRLTPTEMLQSGLETTLNTCSEAIIGALVQEKKVEKKKSPSALPPPVPPPLFVHPDDTLTASVPPPCPSIIVHIASSSLAAAVPVAAAETADAGEVCSRHPSCASLANIDFATPPNTPTTDSFSPVGLILAETVTPSASTMRKPPLIVVCEWDEGVKGEEGTNTGKELRTIFGERRTHKISSSASSGTNTGGSTSMVAIDSKIEQAMDLVKTHLMFAVREEVEVLRGRIVDLENTVCNLEAENAVLRKHVSEEILRNMNN
ncbi:hypothetical protein PENTCL1PPCAC_26847 [Pristionchus entomophagus]|uniref:Uncharacterized protein n=1 Tax=Pristionchus entomophagus TaxID=358040 RepID=A0AAV5UEF6_9BILA|nr:hypothetical protein PENTCL1PPCAC_26847 [Pristionchus entomophagus]